LSPSFNGGRSGSLNCKPGVPPFFPERKGRHFSPPLLPPSNRRYTHPFLSLSATSPHRPCGRQRALDHDGMGIEVPPLLSLSFFLAGMVRILLPRKFLYTPLPSFCVNTVRPGEVDHSVFAFFFLSFFFLLSYPSLSTMEDVSP